MSRKMVRARPPRPLRAAANAPSRPLRRSTISSVRLKRARAGVTSRRRATPSCGPRSIGRPVGARRPSARRLAAFERAVSKAVEFCTLAELSSFVGSVGGSARAHDLVLRLLSVHTSPDALLRSSSHFAIRTRLVQEGRLVSRSASRRFIIAVCGVPSARIMPRRSPLLPSCSLAPRARKARRWRCPAPRRARERHDGGFAFARVDRCIAAVAVGAGRDLPPDRRGDDAGMHANWQRMLSAACSISTDFASSRTPPLCRKQRAPRRPTKPAIADIITIEPPPRV